MGQGGHNKIQGPGRICSTSEIAEFLGVSYETVQNDIAKGAPISERGGKGKQHQIAAGEYVRWMVRRAAEREDGDLLNYDAARTRKMNADAQVAELDLAERRGEVVEVGAVVSVVTDMLAEIKAKLLSIPSRLAHRLAAVGTREAAMEILEKEITGTLNELTADEVVIRSTPK